MQKILKSVEVFQSYDHKCTATFFRSTVYTVEVIYVTSARRGVWPPTCPFHRGSGNVGSARGWSSQFTSSARTDKRDRLENTRRGVSKQGEILHNNGEFIRFPGNWDRRLADSNSWSIGFFSRFS